MLTDKLTAMEKHNSLFEQAIRRMPVSICAVFRDGDGAAPVSFNQEGEKIETPDIAKVSTTFPKTIAVSRNRVLFAGRKNRNPAREMRVAVLFSGGPAAGGHNVLAGLEAVLGGANTLMGVRAGPKGLLKGDLFEIGEREVEGILNTGGFDFLGSDRTKIKTDEQFQAVR